MYVNELAREYGELVAMLTDSDADEEVINDSIEAVSGEIEVQLDVYGAVREELLGDLAKIKVSVDRLTKKKKAIEANIERLEKAIDLGMKTIGQQELKTGLYRFHYKKNPAKLVLDDDICMDDVPVEFLKFIPPEIKKAEVKTAIKNGASFDWCHMEQDVVLKID